MLEIRSDTGSRGERIPFSMLTTLTKHGLWINIGFNEGSPIFGKFHYRYFRFACILL